ncbi:hypothetical protein [Cellulomonas sp. ATA003]|uniref:helix-hairpin-helix domain-containing protein n=1 Tax=Cellulomonas sp. ATA003 TaxID=3073064 RepID=UPI0037BECCC0
MVAERARGGPFTDLRDLARRVRLTTPQLEALATGGALAGVPGSVVPGSTGAAPCGRQVRSRRRAPTPCRVCRSGWPHRPCPA